MSQSPQIVCIDTTFSSEQEAEKFAQALLSKKWVGCAQIMAIQSHYLWKGQVENQGEWLCRLKTLPVKISEIETYIEAHHGYETPEVLISTMRTSQSYLEWLQEELNF